MTTRYHGRPAAETAPARSPTVNALAKMHRLSVMETVASRRLPQRANRVPGPLTPCELAERPDHPDPCRREGSQQRNRPRTGLRQAAIGAGLLVHERVNAVRPVRGALQVKGKMSEQTTPFSFSVFRRNLSGGDGLIARSAARFRRPSQTELLSLQQAGFSRQTRGAPARGRGLTSAARRIAKAAAPMELSHGQQDAHRRHPPGRDPGRGVPWLAYRRV
ncbi:hypothetical protein BOSE62_40059 [Bosea sp. 62]|nr:hypothetical protein BOSE46_120729 [Bosea sp. 46]CAD5264823.1 hypothetical protein BOSE21B_110965 [Bosea sp. 21B]CAD5275490.1 hypothetical protein BOSE7B_40249 [Bosea sp. 7B]VVT59147.1 hypothetical protein BOS5A_201014 [Bosea sp. EC-HK365B]VXB71384.1 hypothetical protein BOSE29B_120040 [Bosea sp. 29B]VXC10816.1 hypothetical protein BOSE125_170035 [Bosea sp. 125]VXC30633.1 hypothetical protein BOSE62_40059 [Bosea sp. 62]VXC75647.1 hypothetical protein BOSE127_40425 [Bosea sp. 127]